MILEKIHDGYPDFQAATEETLKEVAERYSAQFRSMNSGLQHLIDKWLVQVEHQGHMTQILNKAAAVEEQARALALQIDEEEFQKKLRDMKSNSKRKKPVTWNDAKEPKNKIAMRAFEELNQIKQKRMEQQNRSRIEEVRKQTK